MLGYALELGYGYTVSASERASERVSELSIDSQYRLVYRDLR